MVHIIYVVWLFTCGLHNLPIIHIPLSTNLKPGNVEAGTSLAKLFARHPHLMERVSVVMSFDAYAMQNLRRELEVVFPSLNADDPSPTKLASPPSSARVGSPHAHELAAAGLAIPDRPHTAGPRPVHGHRRGVSVSGSAVGIGGARDSGACYPDQNEHWRCPSVGATYASAFGWR